MKPALLLLHAFPLDSRMWESTMAAFERDYRVVAPNASDLLAAGPSIPAMARAAHALMGSDPYIAVGVSMGGYIALELIGLFPKSLAGLVLVDTKAASDTPEARAGRDALIDDIRERGVALATQAMVSRLVAPSAGPDVKARIRAIVGEQDPRVVIQCSRAMRDRRDNTDLLPNISVPTLVVRGGDDLLMTREAMLAMAESIPNGRFVSLSGCGHLPPLEQSEEFNNVLRNFLA
jgi:pimeloyl-ACP methyl ester carboxylesterase